MNTLSPLSYLSKALLEYPERNCLKIQGISFSYYEFYKKLNPLKSFFAGRGVSRSKKVAIYTDDDLLMLTAIFSLWEMGAVAIPMNIKYGADKLRKIEENIKPDFGFYSSNLNIGNINSFPAHAFSTSLHTEEKNEDCTIDEKSLALIMFTSGSTGIPKAVPITHEAVFYNSSLTAQKLSVSGSDKILVNTPPYTTSSLIHVLTMFSKGASVVIERGFMFGSDLWSQILQHDCTGFGGVPVHFSRILSALHKSKEKGKLRFLMNSGEHLPVPLIKKVREHLPEAEIYCVYGLTEVAGRLCILENRFLDTKMGSVGKPLPNMQLTIRNEDGMEAMAGEEGQVYVEGPLLTEGYLNNEKVNKIEFTQWGFATGDFGYKDEDGFLFLKGRKDDIIKVGGEKVSVKMIEEVLYDFEDFNEFIVYPVYDENMGCLPLLQYTLKEGAVFDKPKFLKFISQKLPATHIPVKFEEVEIIERTSSGKTIRKKIV